MDYEGIYDVALDFQKIEFIESNEIKSDRKMYQFVVVYRKSGGRPKYYEITKAQFEELENVGQVAEGTIYLEKLGTTLYNIVSIDFKGKKEYYEE